MRHLYVHIPFCRTPCAYCDFASEPVGPHARMGTVDRYIEALQDELGEWAGVGGGDGRTGGVDEERRAAGLFQTVYLGGGTPTVVAPDRLLGLVRDLATRLGITPGVIVQQSVGVSAPEFTIEANPGTIDSDILRRLCEAGVTRLSVGVQSFVPQLRTALGRRVSQREIEDALAAVIATGWKEWNMDLVFGIPGQTWGDAAADIDAAVSARPTHISLYDLTYTRAFRTRVDATLGAGARRAAGAFAEKHYADAAAKLEAAGYRRYEVSNFAIPGHECRHNQAYWRGEDYLGVGASAVSTFGMERRTNPRSVRDYLAGRPAQVELLSQETRMWEKAMLGLRTSDGVDEAAVLPVVDHIARDRLLAQGCLERRYGKLRLNPGFLDVSNTVIGALLVRPGES